MAVVAEFHAARRLDVFSVDTTARRSHYVGALPLPRLCGALSNGDARAGLTFR